jgi:hypothetical protein
MASAEIACVCSAVSSGICSLDFLSASRIAGNSLKRSMKRRSIQSFQRHTQSPRA